MYNRNLRFLVGKAETTPGTAVAITGSDINYRIREADWTPNNEGEDDKWATGDLAENESIPGNSVADTRCKFKLAKSAAVNTVPDWSTWAESLGLKRLAYGSTGMTWVPHTDNDNRTMSQRGLEMEVGPTPQQRYQDFKGMIGTGKLMSAKRGKPVGFEASYKGAWVAPDGDILTGNRLLPVTPDTSVAERFLGSTLSIFGAAHLAEMFELDFANELSESGDQTDGSGVGFYYISARAPRFKVQVPMQRVSGFDPSNAWKVGTVGPVVLTISSNFKLTLPRGQIIDSKPIDVNKKMFWDLTFKCLRNNSADATMDAQAVWELLYGSKT